jgi:hypothetical protein
MVRSGRIAGREPQAAAARERLLGPRYSTVTVLARLRGWSTFSPRLRATA